MLGMQGIDHNVRSSGKKCNALCKIINMLLIYFRQRIVPYIELVESAKDDLMMSL